MRVYETKKRIIVYVIRNKAIVTRLRIYTVSCRVVDTMCRFDSRMIIIWYFSNASHRIASRVASPSGYLCISIYIYIRGRCVVCSDTMREEKKKGGGKGSWHWVIHWVSVITTTLNTTSLSIPIYLYIYLYIWYTLVVGAYWYDNKIR